ncbi:MAG TPA: TonB family protein [Cyclobacteriaceae bacterium]
MKTQYEHIQRWDDIIFEKRNKEYGAYAIRKDYNTRVLKAEAISVGIGALIFIIPILMRDEIPLPVQQKDDPVIVLDRWSDRIEPTVTPPPPPKAPKRMSASIIPTRVTTQEVPDEPQVPPTDEVTYVTGNETEGTETGLEGPIEPGAETSPAEVGNKPFDVVEIMPEYEGGNEAMIKFLQKKLRYPSRARAGNKQGTVYVRFIVNADGSVSDVEVIKGFFKDCDEEAVRVVSLMDKWKPGVQGKLPVAVRKVLPITFRLGNQE